jgi:hypothetical protein
MSITLPRNVQAVESMPQGFSRFWFQFFEGIYTLLTSIPGGNIVPTASLLQYAGPSPPAGFLTCNGAAVSRTTYATLFGVIGTTYGAGDGLTTFNLPNVAGAYITMIRT